MKPKIAAIGTSVLLLHLSFNRPAQANPALIAPAAGICGATGVGCVLIGTVIIGGIVYYVYTHNGQKVLMPKQNTRPVLDDPDNPSEEWHEPIYARSQPQAKKICQQRAKQYKVELVNVTHNGTSFICIFKSM